ncbi:hypothetical protein BS78_02G005400, partial [Paspalum vaginatum]
LEGSFAAGFQIRNSEQRRVEGPSPVQGTNSAPRHSRCPSHSIHSHPTHSLPAAYTELPPRSVPFLSTPHQIEFILPTSQPSKRTGTRVMEMQLLVAVVLLLAAVASRLPSAAVAANYTVGDEKGWNPDVDYTAWVKKHKPFYKGDWLIFEYQNGRSDVVQVDEVGYDNCDKANALTSYSKGHTYAFQLKEAKDYYFICSYGYCYSGMKLHVTAKSSSSSSSSGSSSSSADDDSSDDTPSPSSKSKSKSSSAAPTTTSLLAVASIAAAALLLNLNRLVV